MSVARLVAIVATVTALGFFGLWIARTKRDDRTLHPKPSDATSAATADDLRAALLTVEWYGREAPPRVDADVPPEFQPLPLKDATRILANDESRYGNSRRIRAIALLASVGMARCDYRDEIRRLGASPEDLDRLLAFQPPICPDGAPPLPVPPLPQPALPPLPVPLPCVIREEVHAYFKLGSAIPGCQVVAGPYMSPPTTNPGTKETSVKVAMEVERAFDGPDGLAAAMDPQNWDRCSPGFFPAAYIPVVLPDGSVDELPNGEPTPHPSPPSPGNTWDGVLYEHFNPAITSSFFKNLLAIDLERGVYPSGVPYMGFTYDLQAIREDSFTGFDLEVDRGDMSMFRITGNRFTVQGSKFVKFTNGTLSDVLEVYLGALAGAASEAACACMPVSSPIVPSTP